VAHSDCGGGRRRWRSSTRRGRGPRRMGGGHGGARHGGGAAVVVPGHDAHPDVQAGAVVAPGGLSVRAVGGRHGDDAVVATSPHPCAWAASTSSPRRPEAAGATVVRLAPCASSFRHAGVGTRWLRNREISGADSPGNSVEDTWRDDDRGCGPEAAASVRAVSCHSADVREECDEGERIDPERPNAAVLVSHGSGPCVVRQPCRAEGIDEDVRTARARATAM
jgi:hypothetical protein